MNIKISKLIKNLLIVAFLLSLLNSCKDEDNSEIIINSFSSWQYKGVDEVWRKCYIPESIQNSLIRDTLMKNLFFGDQFLKNYWTDTVNWIYKSSILIDKYYSDNHFEINVSGLVGVADVYLNDSLVFKCNDMFITYNKDVSHIVHKGSNNLVLKFLNYKKAKILMQHSSKYKLPFGGQEMIRLPYYYFDTISGIRYLPTGLSKNITLTQWNKAIIRQSKFELTALKYNEYAKIRTTYIIEASKRINTVIQIKEKNKVLYKKNIYLKKGVNKYICDFEIKKPKLWWTHDLGEPYLYNLKTILSSDDIDIQILKNNIGIRKIEIDTTNHDFKLKLNNIPLVLKIFDYISPDIFYENLNNEKYKKIVNDFVLANANTVHVTEKGRYEDVNFYNECDKRGILVWQDFMLPYKIVDLTEDLEKNIVEESSQNIEFLRNHPCIAFWSGQNSFQKYWIKYKNRNLNKDSLEILRANKKIYEQILPKLITEKGCGVYYFDVMDFSSIVNITDNIPEFPHIITIRKISNQDDRHPQKDVIKLHQKPYNADSIISVNLEQAYTFIPTDITAYSYMSYLFKKDYLEEKIIKQRFNSQFNGFIIGNYADYSPVISSSAVDYDGYWKGKMYAIKNAFEPVLFNITEEKGWVYININSDLDENIQADFYLKLSDFNGKVYWRRNYISSIISKKQNRTYFSFNLTRELSKMGKSNAVFKIEVFHNQDLFAEKYFEFVPLKKQSLKEPKINKKFYTVDNGYVIEFTTDYFANGVYIYTDKEGILDDNIFCLGPGETKKVKFITNSNIYSIENSFNLIDFTGKTMTNLFSIRKKQ